MIIPEKPGYYEVVLFNGERNDPIEGETGYFDGKNWSLYCWAELNTRWHPNHLVIEVVEKKEEKQCIKVS